GRCSGSSTTDNVPRGREARDVAHLGEGASMARELRLPELAESVVEGEIVRWLVEEGERVELDQPVVEVMTDKVTVELPSPFAGVLLERLAGEGDVVARSEEHTSELQSRENLVCRLL